MPRPYTSARRASSATATREAVLDAALELFSQNGYALTSLAAIARRADVALNTVYVSVGGKSDLVAALVQRSLGERIDHWEAAQPPPESRDGRETVAILVHNIRITFEPSLAVLRVMMESARADKQVRTAAETSRERYRTIIETTASRLVESDLLLAGLDTSHITDVLWFFLNVDSWRVLEEMGWSWDRSERWLTEQTCQALFGVAQAE